jgi:hypothetical protein
MQHQEQVELLKKNAEDITDARKQLETQLEHLLSPTTEGNNVIREPQE